MRHQRRGLGILVLILRVQQQQLEFAKQVFHESGHFLILYEQIMPAGDILHDVSFDLLVLQYRVAVVDQDGRRGGLEIGAEIGWWLLHIHGGHLQRNRLQLRQKIQVHKILLTKEAGALSTAIDRRCLDDQLDLGHVAVTGAVLVVVVRHPERDLGSRRGRKKALLSLWRFTSALASTGGGDSLPPW